MTDADLIARIRAELERMELHAQLRAADQQREYGAACERWKQHNRRDLVSAHDWAVFTGHYYQHERVWTSRKAAA